MHGGHDLREEGHPSVFICLISRESEYTGPGSLAKVRQRREES